MTESTVNQNFDIFSLVLLRDHLLPELLQDDQSEITYWAGKSIANEFQLTGANEIQNFFMSAGFGYLSNTSQKSLEQKWLLNGPVVDERLLKHPDASFAFEAGFLAQEIQQLTNCGAEAQWEAGKNSVTITVITEESIEMPD